MVREKMATTGFCREGAGNLTENPILSKEKFLQKEVSESIIN